MFVVGFGFAKTFRGGFANRKNPIFPYFWFCECVSPNFEDAVVGIKNPAMVPTHLFHPQIILDFCTQR